MIIYFADRQMNITGTASTSLNGMMITDDKKTVDIDTGVSSFEFSVAFEPSRQFEMSQKLAVGNYVLRANESEAEFYTIIETETSTGEIRAYTEDAGLDLLNEVVGEFGATQAYSAEYYINKFSSGSGFEIGVNEISDLTRKLKWEGEATACERIRSVATQFGNAEISYSFEIKGLNVTKKLINIWKKRGGENVAQFRVGVDIDSLTIKTSIANLATALHCTGGTVKNKPITLKGYTYDDGEFYVENGKVCSRTAYEKWARYSATSGHITKQYSYDTTTQSTLCSHAITELKKVMEPELNIDCDIVRGAERFSIGDRVDIIDQQGEAYFSGRVLKIEESITSGTKKATFGDYLIKSSGIADTVYSLATQFSELAKARTLYTWFAYADDGDGNGISLDSTGKKYLGIAVNQETSEADISDPSVFSWTAIEGGESDSFHLTITSSNGVLFKNGLVATTLTAHVYKNGVELTEEAVAGVGAVKWYEVNGEEIGSGLTKNISDVEVANIVAKLEEI